MDKKILLIVLECFAIFLSVSDAGKYINIDGREYYISNPLKKNWYEALRYCKYQGMALVDINNEKENNRILSIIQSPEYINGNGTEYWTSGTDLGSEGNFYWASSGHSVLFSDYSENQPDNQGYVVNPGNIHLQEDCLEIRSDYNWKWNDNLCDGEKFFICRDLVAQGCQSMKHN